MDEASPDKGALGEMTRPLTAWRWRGGDETVGVAGTGRPCGGEGRGATWSDGSVGMEWLKGVRSCMSKAHLQQRLDDRPVARAVAGDAGHVQGRLALTVRLAGIGPLVHQQLHQLRPPEVGRGEEGRPPAHVVVLVHRRTVTQQIFRHLQGGVARRVYQHTPFRGRCVV